MFENIQKSGSDTISIDFYNVIKVMEVGDFPGVKTTSGHIEWIAVTIKIFDVTGGGSFLVFSFFICNVVKFDEARLIQMFVETGEKVAGYEYYKQKGA